MSKIWSKLPLQTIVNFEVNLGGNKGDVEPEEKHEGKATGTYDI